MISLIMIAALAISLINGMVNAWGSLDASIRKFLSEYGIADAVVSTEMTETDTAEKIRGMDGVARVVARLTGSSQIVTPSGSTLTAQIISMDREDILKVYHWKETENQAGDYVLVDYWFAAQNGISAGDTLQIRTGEDEYRPFYVGAVVSAPETLAKTKLTIGGMYYPDFGFIYVPVSLLETETERKLDRMTAEWKEKEEEYLQAEQELRDAWQEGQAELAEAWNELEKQEKEFGEKKNELMEQIRQLTEGRAQLMIGRRELQDAEETADERKEQLEQELERISGQLLELEDRQAELTEVRNDLNSLLVQLEDAKGRLRIARDQINSKKGELYGTLSTLRSARTAWQGIQNTQAEIELPDMIAEQGITTVAEIEAKLSAYGITPESLDEWISEAEYGAGQLESGQNRIQEGINQINREYLPEIQAYLEETEQGLATVIEVHDMLRGAVAELENGLKSITDFEQEAPDSREEINRKLQEVEEGIQAIYSGLAEGETALSEGREQLTEKSTEAEEAHSEAEAELAEGARSLQEAWDELMAWEGYTPMRNEFLIWFDPEVTDQRQALKAIENALDVPVQNSELYDDSRVADAINDNLIPLWSMSLMIPLLFVGIMMVVLFLFLSIMIRQTRQSIGILRALGFGKSQVRRVFSITCVILMLLASALGGGFSFVITLIFNMYYQKYFMLPEYLHTFNGTVFALSAAGFVLLALCAVMTTSGTLGRIQPAEAVSRATPPPPKISRFSRKLLKRAKPLSKFSLLSLRRNPFRFVTSVICISGAVSIIFAAFSFITAKNEVLREVFGHQLRYDAQIVFADEPEETASDAIRRMESIREAERFWVREEDIAYGKKTVRGSLMFLEPDTGMVALTDMQGNPMAYPTEGIVLSNSTAKELGVSAGETITVGETPVTVTGISRQRAMYFQFLPASERDRFRKADQTGWMVRQAEGADGKDITEGLYRENGYVTTLWRDLIRKGYQDLYEQFDLYSWMLVFLCGIVGIFIVVNTDRNNLQEQKLSLSILRAIGFRHRQISAHWFLQSLLNMACSLVIGFAAGYVIAVKGLEILSNSSRHLEYIPAAFQYIWTTACTFAFLLAGHMISTRSMKKWDLVENTKGRE